MDEEFLVINPGGYIYETNQASGEILMSFFVKDFMKGGDYIGSLSGSHTLTGKYN